MRGKFNKRRGAYSSKYGNPLEVSSRSQNIYFAKFLQMISFQNGFPKGFQGVCKGILIHFFKKAMNGTISSSVKKYLHVVTAT